LDEIVEARQDTMVVIHSLTDHRRELSLDKKGELIKAHPDFQLVISYNPGYQSLMKDLKQSTKQRFCGLDFDYANKEDEAIILMIEGQVEQTIADKLVEVGRVARKLKGHGLDEGISTRLMVYAAKLINQGISPIDASKMAMVRPITDDADIRESLDNAIELIFG
jgi:nitric oxide reductase NorQ protein